MKKIILTLAICLLCSTNVQAKEDYVVLAEYIHSRILFYQRADSWWERHMMAEVMYEAIKQFEAELDE